MIRTMPIITVPLLVLAVLTHQNCVTAQQYPPVDGRQFPLNQMNPPGTAAQWAANVGRGLPRQFQPVQIRLPSTGQVTIYEAANRPVELGLPAQVGLIVGNIYRLRVRGLEDFPGVEFYPTIELIDRLHPPAGREEDFPIDFELTVDELEWAANGQLVTKVVYLEQPQRVPKSILTGEQRILTVEPSHNALAEADALGRPMAIVRIGGRTPDPLRPDPYFFGPGGPLRIAARPPSTMSKQTVMNPISHRQSGQ